LHRKQRFNTYLFLYTKGAPILRAPFFMNTKKNNHEKI